MIISDAKIRMKKTVVKWFSTSCWFFFDEKQKNDPRQFLHLTVEEFLGVTELKDQH